MEERSWRKEGIEVKEVNDWISVNRGRKHPLVFNNKELITLFVDNIPEEANRAWLSKTFTDYGIVKETYIPAKRSNRGSRFGFVRYDCPISDGVAVTKASGLQVGDNKLFVKVASFNLKLKRDNGNHLRSSKDITESSYKGALSWKKAESNHLAQENSYAHATFDKGKSYAQAVSGLEGQVLPTKSIKIQQSGNEWLLRSAVAILHRRMPCEYLAKVLKREESQISEVRSMGGRFILITFLNSDARDISIKENWWELWFESIKPWNGEAAGKERFVWLSCTGVPLNAWDTQTFKKIGEIWGIFMELDESSLKLLSFDKGRILIATSKPHKIVDKIQLEINYHKYVVDIIEEEWDSSSQMQKSAAYKVSTAFAKTSPDTDLASHNAMMEQFVNLHGECKDNDKGKQGNLFMKSTNSSFGVNKEGIVMENNLEGSLDSLVPDSVDNPIWDINSAQGNFGLDLVPFGGAAQVEVDSDLSESHSNTGESNGICSQINLRPSQVKSINILVDLNPSACNMRRKEFIPKVNASFEERSRSHNLIVSSESSQDYISETNSVEDDYVEGNNKENVEIHHEGNQSIPVKAALKGIKGKKKRKTIEDILGYSKFTPQKQKGGRNKQKCVVLRSAVAAAALSVSLSSDCIANRNRILLNEAQAIWAVNKTMGIGYDGDEDEVISKIAEMEAQNMDRAACDL